MSSSRSEQKAATREAIAKAARERFATVGYESTTIRDIATRAGVSIGSVHVHFKDKRALLFDCFFADIHRALREGWGTLDADAPLVEQLVHLSRTLFEGYCRHPKLSRVMFKESLFVDASEPKDPEFEPFLHRVSGLFSTALERGEIRRLPGGGRLEAELFFSIYLGVLIGGLNEHFGPIDDAKSSATAWADRVRALLELAVQGLKLPDSA